MCPAAIRSIAINGVVIISTFVQEKEIGGELATAAWNGAGASRITKGLTK